MIIIPANLEGINTLKDGSIKLTFETQELSPENVGNLFACRNKLGYLSFKPETFTEEQINLLESLKVEEFENEKSPSKRMRNVLYRLWQQDSMGYKDPNLYYINRMNDLIDMLKSEFDH